MSKKNILKTGVIGVVLGVIGGILFAPKSGKETRDDIKDAAAKANREAEKKLKELHAELKEKSEEAKELAVKLTGQAKEELEDLGRRAEFTRDRVGELITSVREYEADDKEVDKTIKDGESVVDKIKKSVTKK